LRHASHKSVKTSAVTTRAVVLLTKYTTPAGIRRTGEARTTTPWLRNQGCYNAQNHRRESRGQGPGWVVSDDQALPRRSGKQLNLMKKASMLTTCGFLLLWFWQIEHPLVDKGKPGASPGRKATGPTRSAGLPISKGPTMLPISPAHIYPQPVSGNGSGARIPRRQRRRAAGAAVGAAALLVWAVAGQSPAYAADAPVGLGTAAAYSVLGGTTVTNTGATTLAGDLGVYPGSAVTGFPPGIVAGAIHAGDAAAGQAQSDLTTAYNDAAGRAATTTVAGDLVGQTLTPGVYKSSGPLAVSGALTLNGQGNPNSVFIFQVASTLTTASASSIVLTNSAQACNIYWQVGSSATLGTGSTFNGNILALTSITATTGTTVQGRALARNGQVSLDTNVFTMPGCATATPSPSATPTAAAVPTAATPTATALPTAVTPIPGASTGTGGTGTGAGTGTGGTGGTGAGTANGRGLNIDTAADNRTVSAGPAIGTAAVATGLIGVLMLTRRRHTVQRNK
jgi:hypothetical protein